MTTLYKRSVRELRLWSIKQESNILTITFGSERGMMQTDTIEHPTTQKALQDYETRVAHKLSREGYSADPNCDPPGGPMLLHNFRAHSHKLPNNVYYQPKLNGHRCIASSNVMLTRRNDIITSMPHIKAELATLPPEITLDGELYCHGLSLQEHGSLIRSHEPQFDHKCIKYVVFDIQTTGKYESRFNTLTSLLSSHSFEHIQLINNTPDHKAYADKYLQHYLDLNYEGTIIRSPFGLYHKDGRSYDALKYKPIYSGWFKVTDMVAATSGREKDAAIVVCQLPNGGTFRARMAEDLPTRKWMFKNKALIVPGAAFIEYNDLTDKGIPEHPRCMEFIGGSSVAHQTKHSQLKAAHHPEIILHQA